MAALKRRKPVALREKVRETTDRWIFSRAVTFREFLDLYGEDDDVELIDGTVVEKMAAQLAHESLLAWLFPLLRFYIDRRSLGIILSSRTAMEINRYRGRIPDIVFVKTENQAIVQERAIFGTPDLVIEVVSPNDRRSDIVALETDYTTLGVPEIVFLDPRRRQARILRKRETGYEETILTSGTLALEAVTGFRVEVEWLFVEPRPDLLDTLTALLSSA